MSLIRIIKNSFHYLNANLAAAYYGYPAKHLTVIGVTGTDGKTTTSTLIYAMLKQSGKSVGLISTVAAYIGSDHIDTGFHVTSPDPWSVQRLIKKMVNLGYTHLVLEATSHGLDQFRLLHTHITIAVVTNITHEHLDYHRTYDRYVQAKAKIFTNAKVAFINHDDQSYAKLVPLIPSTCQIIAYSLTDSDTDITACIKKRFPETYNQSNALAASLAAGTAGAAEAASMTAITQFEGVPGRLQRINNSKKILVVVDFAHTPNALEKVLTALRPQTKGKLIVVFGAAGKRDQSKRPLMGKIASQLADEVVITAEDPRGEDVRLNIAQIKSGAVKNYGHLHGIVDRREAIRFAVGLAKPGDTVVACGKGHETSMNLDGKHELPWSDTAVMTEVLEN